MSSLPLAVRIAAGIAATAVERVRRLPQDLAELPVIAVSQAVQVSMRVQQRITDLAIKGDDAIAQLRSPAEEPPWAVFDEDLDDNLDDLENNLEDGTVSPGRAIDVNDRAAEAALAREWYGAELDPDADEPPGTAATMSADQGPDVLPTYPELTLASVRARLRTFSPDELHALLDYERAHADREEFVRMLTNRISTVSNR